MEYLVPMAASGRTRQLIPGTVRVVSLRMDYLPGDTQMAQRLAQPEKAYVSRYALGRDYHKLVRKRVQFLAVSSKPSARSATAPSSTVPQCWRRPGRAGRAGLDRQEHPAAQPQGRQLLLPGRTVR